MSNSKNNQGIMNDKVAKGFLITVIMVNIAFLLLIIPYAYKTMNNEYCGTTNINAQGSGTEIMMTFDNNTDYILFDSIIKFNEQKYSLAYTYCITINTSSYETLELELENADGSLSKNTYVDNTSLQACFYVDKEIHDKIKISCENCNASKQLNLLSYVASLSEEEYVFNDNNSLLRSIDEPLIQNTKILVHCKKLFNKIILWLLLIDGFFIVLFAMMKGIDYLRGEIDGS